MTSQVGAPQTRSTDPASTASVRGRLAALGPGMAVAAGATGAVLLFAHFVPAVSPLLIAIVLGAALSNAIALPARVKPGLSFAAKKLLRVGVALLGLQLVLGDILGLGVGMIAVVVAIVVLGIFGTMVVGRLLGLSWTQRFLIGCGFSICGAAAVAAVDGVIDAEEEEVLTAVALVVIFGTLMIPVIPLASHLIGLSDQDAGMWAGGSIHEVAQVVAAGGAVGGGALAVAVVVKLARVIMLAPVIAIVSARQRRINRGANDVKRPPIIPMFVVAFIVCAAVRTTGVVPESVLAGAKLTETAMLTAAMFALGVGVNIAGLRKVGIRPFVLAVLSTVWVAGIALTGVLLVG
ncbi:putative sulfate exporter family transporter [Mycobacterium sp. 21AC1]|uniref:YeiH family protein n=1 Tax=[Mycobacterium] appelbergii TaxID=2939269 RepID=UPI002938D39E|nr:putative sulfate exporter family transporter [Mycobacterium sp. 21AC1]MDV3130326.1 putative sulfate exporter family transporter [Mycobacterium sp. 21AC1]